MRPIKVIIVLMIVLVKETPSFGLPLQSTKDFFSRDPKAQLEKTGIRSNAGKSLVIFRALLMP
jgi:hypothetical protein